MNLGIIQERLSVPPVSYTHLEAMTARDKAGATREAMTARDQPEAIKEAMTARDKVEVTEAMTARDRAEVTEAMTVRDPRGEPMISGKMVRIQETNQQIQKLRSLTKTAVS